MQKAVHMQRVAQSSRSLTGVSEVAAWPWGEFGGQPLMKKPGVPGLSCQGCLDLSWRAAEMVKKAGGMGLSDMDPEWRHGWRHGENWWTFWLGTQVPNKQPSIKVPRLRVPR